MRKTVATITLAGTVMLGLVGSVHAATTPGTAIVQTALRYLHAPYKQIGQNPRTGFSDVGFVAYVLRKNGLAAPASRGKLLKLGTPIPLANLQPGDLLFFRNTVWAGLSHVGIYVGNGTFVHSEWYGYGVTVTSLTNDPRDGQYWTDHFLAADRITTSG